jgi:hypothetical protein
MTRAAVLLWERTDAEQLALGHKEGILGPNELGSG